MHKLSHSPRLCLSRRCWNNRMGANCFVCLYCGMGINTLKEKKMHQYKQTRSLLHEAKTHVHVTGLATNAVILSLACLTATSPMGGDGKQTKGENERGGDEVNRLYVLANKKEETMNEKTISLLRRARSSDHGISPLPLCSSVGSVIGSQRQGAADIRRECRCHPRTDSCHLFWRLDWL